MTKIYMVGLIIIYKQLLIRIREIFVMQVLVISFYSSNKIYA